MHQTLNVDTKQPGFNFNVFHKSRKRCSSNTVPDPDATTTMLGAVFSPSLPQTCLLSLWPNSSVFVFLAHPFGQLGIPAELEGVDFGAGAPSCPRCCKMSFTGGLQPWLFQVVPGDPNPLPSFQSSVVTHLKNLDFGTTA